MKIGMLWLMGVKTVWGSSSLPSGELPSKHSVIHAVAQQNCGRPSMCQQLTGIMLLGEVIFNQIAEHAEFDRGNLSVGFPSLIYHMCIAQHPTLLRSGVRFTDAPKRFSCDHKLFKGKHIENIPSTGG